MTTLHCGKAAALVLLAFGSLSLGTPASAASLAGTQSVDTPVAGIAIEKVGHRGGFYLSIGPGYYDDYGYAPYGGYGYYPRYGRYYDYDDDYDDDDDGYYPRYYGGRSWARERFEHPLGRR